MLRRRRSLWCAGDQPAPHDARGRRCSQLTADEDADPYRLLATAGEVAAALLDARAAVRVVGRGRIARGVESRGFLRAEPYPGGAKVVLQLPDGARTEDHR